MEEDGHTIASHLHNSIHETSRKLTSVSESLLQIPKIENPVGPARVRNPPIVSSPVAEGNGHGVHRRPRNLLFGKKKRRVSE